MPLSWSEYDKLPRELQDELVQIRLPDGTTAWTHPSGQAVSVVPPPAVTDDEWTKQMSDAQKFEYARSHSGAR
jgi:hypothetical protein